MRGGAGELIERFAANSIIKPKIFALLNFLA